MKRTHQVLAFAAILNVITLSGWGADTPSLSDELSRLSASPNVAPVSTQQVDPEKLYSIQDRYVALSSRSEISILASNHFSSEDFISSQDLGATYRFHLNNRWSLALSGAVTFNRLTDAGERLMTNEGILPDSTYTRYRGDLLVTFNTLYGKFRLSMDEVLYFDQYISLGGGVVRQQFGTQPAGVADVGLAFWLGKSGSFRMGLKDQIHYEQRRLSSSVVHDFLGYISVGYLFGGGESS